MRKTLSSEIVAVGHITVADLQQALVSGTAPLNPENGQLWIDSSGSKSVLKVWRNGRWEDQVLDIENLDPDLSETIESILTSLGNMADDGQLDFTNRSTLVTEIAEIIGSTPSRASGNVYTSSLPDYTVLDSQGVGSFASVRRTYRDVEGDTSASEYIALQQAYTELNSYLSGHSLKPWDVTRANRDRVVTITDPDLFRERFLEYFLAELALSSENERLAIKRAEEYTDRITDGSSVVDKTEILSGTEIYTEKADDSVVHVEVDGKSYQPTDPNNLFDIEEWFRVPDSEKPVTTGVPYIELNLEPLTQYTVSTNIPDRNGNYDVFAMPTDQNASSGINGLSEGNSRVVSTIGNGILKISMRSFSLDKSSGYWIKVEKGATATPFKGYSTPTPDYPIEINSLNNVDVVSQKSEGGTIDDLSVGGRNLLRNSDFSDGLTYMNGWNTNRGLVNDDEYGEVLRVRPTNSSNFFSFSSLTEEFYEGEEVVISFYAKGQGRISQIRLGGSGSNAYSVTNSNTADIDTNEWRQYSFKTSVIRDSIGTNTQLRMAAYDTDNLLLTRFKVSKSNVKSDWTPAPEDITEDDNHPLIDKINLTFSEPLRSRGNVCDRLIRREGVWVVERNINVVNPEDGTRTIEETYGVLGVPIYEELSQDYQDKLNNLKSFSNSNYLYTLLPDGQGGYY